MYGCAAHCMRAGLSIFGGDETCGMTISLLMQHLCNAVLFCPPNYACRARGTHMCIHFSPAPHDMPMDQELVCEHACMQPCMRACMQTTNRDIKPGAAPPKCNSLVCNLAPIT